ncbi:UPF0187-domain-containing protein [Massarina eburnea CBS 473.64]|uniref:UPF0187-domain-containing protein n=1 Tax=Massarina eburnea CBS 473.64 TaxID=1395130 RepID=A0A6A6RND7_9PLEO|nr:UPF0187-domain-containing protein [Massarina eburnea CBS 473.64]
MGSSDASKTLKPTTIEIPESSSGGSGRGSGDEVPLSPRSWRERQATYKTPSRRTSVDAAVYFQGPRDMAKHSKWPFFLRMHGSVLPKMILPLFIVTIWSTAITCVCQFVWELKVSNLLLTVLGFVVGLAISFRTSSAYERYTEGRKYWSQLQLVGQNLARTIWIHASERPGELGKQDLLNKISALNLIVAFSHALVHKLRFEPGINYPNFKERVEYLETFAKAAEAEIPQRREPGKFKAAGEYLGVTFAESNPRKLIKKAKRPLGNLPLEILNHLSAYVQHTITNDTLTVGLYQNQAITSVVALNEVLIGVDRILSTPLPIAYSIAISQITWVYVMMLPFQLWDDLRWVTIPGCIFAAYIIIGMNAIGREIENPFGNDVNDLPLELFCEELELDIDYIMSNPPPHPEEFFTSDLNCPLQPLSPKNFMHWMKRSKQDIRDALMSKTKADMRIRPSFQGPRSEGIEEKMNSIEHSHDV